MNIRDWLSEGITRTPYDHQFEAVEFFDPLNDGNLFFEMGTGKTGTAIMIYRNWCRKAGRMLRALVLSPSVVIHNWKDEFGMFSKFNEAKIHPLSQSSGSKKAEYMFNKVMPQIEGAVVITNYESLLNNELFQAIYRWNPEVIIYDEVHMIKNPKAKRTKLCIKLSELALKRLGLSGTPILKNSNDMFGIFRSVDCGSTFGINQYVFQARYLIDKNARIPHVNFPNWVDNPSTYQELQSRIYRKSIRKLKEECLDLPELIKMERKVPLSAEQLKTYKELKRDFLAFIDARKKNDEPETVTANLAITKAMRMLQVVSGYVQLDSGEIHEFNNNPRLEITEELLNEIVVEGENKCILWCSYKYNYIQLSNLCKKLGIQYVLLTGEQSTAEKRESEIAFRTNPNVKVIIANRRAGGVGVNLVEAKYSIVYSRNFSLDEELQSESRNHRSGSGMHDSIIKIDLIANDTIEIAQMEALKNKKQISRDILDIIK